MERALALARCAAGRTSPNPAVGAVIVKDGRIAGEGYTQPPGGPHAEVVALAQAGAVAAGATMYVTLEPCCHFGRTPPCTQAIIAAGIGVVEVATFDPNPRVDGRGCAELEAAGVHVRVGQGAAEARHLNEAFAKFIATGLPFVTVKWAMTLDGKIASRSGHSRWVTGETARHRVHQLRDVSDAIVVGANTVIADDPELTVRLPEEANSRCRPARQPLRVVVASRGRLPLTARLFSPELAPGTIVATTAAADPEWQRRLRDRGTEVLVLPDCAGRVDLRALLVELGRRERMAVLVEGGGVLAAALLQAGLADKVCAFIAPKIIGGTAAPSPVAGEGLDRMDQALRLERLQMERLDDDVLLIGYPAPQHSFFFSERSEESLSSGGETTRFAPGGGAQ